MYSSVWVLLILGAILVGSLILLAIIAGGAFLIYKLVKGAKK